MSISSLLESRIIQGPKFTTKLTNRSGRVAYSIQNASKPTVVITHVQKTLALLQSVHAGCYS